MDYETLRHALYSKARAEEDRTGKHIKYYAEIKGTRRFVTLISHSAKGQISKDLFARMARQMRLSSRQLQQFVDCAMGREEWMALWEGSPS